MRIRNRATLGASLLFITVVVTAGCGSPDSGQGASNAQPSSATGENEAPQTSAGTTAAEDVSIENLTRPATPEQIDYVLQNPVSVKEFPSAADALVEIGKRVSVIYHTDPESLTPAEDDALYASVYDASSPHFQMLRDSLDQRREMVAAEYFLNDENFEATFSIEPTGESPTFNVAGVGVNANVLYGGNADVYENMGANQEALLDANANFTIKKIDGEWRLWGTDSVSELHDIG